MAQIPHEPTDERKRHVYDLASYGVPQRLIAKSIGISVPTLLKYYDEELHTAQIEKIKAVSAALFQNAINGNITAQCFFLKTQAQWREVDREEAPNESPQIHKIQVDVIGAKKADDKE